MQSNTSTEFLDAVAFLHKEKWEEDHPIYHYLAQLTAQVRQLGEMFAKQPREITKEEFLLKFREEDAKETITLVTNVARSVPTQEPMYGMVVTEANKPDYLPKEAIGRRMVEIGPKAMEDPKWKKINEETKSLWGARLRKLRDGNAT